MLRFTGRMSAIAMLGLSLTAMSAFAQDGAADPHEGHDHAPGEHRAIDEDLNSSIMLFKSDTVALGEVLDTEPVPLEFEFKNTGSEELEVRLVKPSCGCTAADMKKTTFAPGESGTIDMTFDPHGRNGALRRNVTVYTNSKTQPVQTLYIDCIVKPVVITQPQVLAFEPVDKGRGAEETISVYGRFPEFEVTRATVQDPGNFEVEVVKVGEEEFQGDTMYRWDLKVKIRENAKPDNYRTELSIRTNDEHRLIFSRAVVARVIGDLELRPVRMTMGRLRVGDRFEREITLRSRSGKAFNITNLNSSNIVLDAEYAAVPVDPEKRDEWTITVKGDVKSPAPRFNSQLFVATDIEDESLVTVQMYGQLLEK